MRSLLLISAVALSGCAMQPHEMAIMSQYDLCDVTITSFETPRSYYARKYARENGIDCRPQRAESDYRKYQAMQGLAVSAAIMNQSRQPLPPPVMLNPFPPAQPQTIIIQQPVRPYRFIDSSPYR